MARLNLEIIHPNNADVNNIFASMERKYAGRAATPETIKEMEKEAARLIRRLITTTRTVYVPAQCQPIPSSLTQPVLAPLPPAP